MLNWNLYKFQKNGKPHWSCLDAYVIRKGGPALKSTQVYPDGYGQSIAKKHAQFKAP